MRSVTRPTLYPRQSISGTVSAEYVARDEPVASVYVMGWDIDGPVKIGVAKDVHARAADLQSGCPYRLMPFYHFDAGQYAYAVEQNTHRMLSARRLEGEWFDLPYEAAAVVAETWHLSVRGIIDQSMIDMTEFAAIDFLCPKLGAKTRGHTKAAGGVSPEMAADIIAAYLEGNLSAYEIGVRFGVAPRTVYRVIARNGTLPRRLHAPRLTPTPASLPGSAPRSRG